MDMTELTYESQYTPPALGRGSQIKSRGGKALGGRDGGGALAVDQICLAFRLLD